MSVTNVDINADAEQLRQQLKLVGEHQRHVWLGEDAALLLVLALPLLAAAMVLDNLLHLHTAVRLVLWGGLLALTALLLSRLVRRLRPAGRRGRLGAYRVAAAGPV